MADFSKGSNDKPSRRNYRGKKLSIEKLNKKINKVYSNIKQEVKVLDSGYTFQISRDGGANDIKALTPVAQGDTDITRDGNQINVKSIQVKGQIYQDVAVQSSTVRIVLFVDRNYLNGTVPTAAMIMESGYFGTPSAPYSMRNRRERERFKIIYDKLFTLNNTGGNTLPFNIYRRLNLKTTFANELNNGYGKNTVWMLTISGQAPDDQPTINCVTRVAFTDS